MSDKDLNLKHEGYWDFMIERCEGGDIFGEAWSGLVDPRSTSITPSRGTTRDETKRGHFRFYGLSTPSKP
ncbi:MAG: hypothetical protein CL912_13010 [Deltaproteobacteria bacterium]|nr:hypothetical protein [Deltaproteobacteria bacterium]